MKNKKTKKTPNFRYGIEITKPFSKEMYDHNDAIALEMKRHILSEIHLAYSQAMGDIAANGGSDAGEKRLRKIGTTIEGMGYGDGYELEDIKDGAINTLANMENWSLHQEYGYLRSENIVPWIKMKMLGFDSELDGCWDCYWEEENPNDEFVSPASGELPMDKMDSAEMEPFREDMPGYDGQLDEYFDGLEEHHDAITKGYKK